MFPILIFRSDHLEAILKAVFLVQRQKTFKPPYLKITFSTYVGNSQNTAEMVDSYPTVTSKMFDPTDDETAISPKPFRATITLVIKSGMEVPAAKNVRPIT